MTGEALLGKDAPGFTLEWTERYPVPRHAGDRIFSTYRQNTATLVWLANAATLELHPFLHRTPQNYEACLNCF